MDRWETEEDKNEDEIKPKKETPPIISTNTKTINLEQKKKVKIMPIYKREKKTKYVKVDPAKIAPPKTR